MGFGSGLLTFCHGDVGLVAVGFIQTSDQRLGVDVLEELEARRRPDIFPREFVMICFESVGRNATAKIATDTQPFNTLKFSASPKDWSSHELNIAKQKVIGKFRY